MVIAWGNKPQPTGDGWTSVWTCLTQQGETVGVIVKLVCGTGEMAQTSKALSALPENPGSIPSIHMVA